MTGIETPGRRDKPQCGAKRRQGPGQCQRPAGWGTPHPGVGPCKLHGGSTRNGVIAGQRALAAQAVRTYGLPVDVSPVDALLDEVRWTAGHVVWLRERVQEVEQDALVWGKTSEVDRGSGEFTGVDTTSEAKPNVWLDLYQRERKHLVEVCKAAISAGVEERRVRLAERQGAEMVGAFRRILAGLGLTAEQLALVPELVDREVRALTGPVVINERT